MATLFRQGKEVKRQFVGSLQVNTTKGATNNETNFFHGTWTSIDSFSLAAVGLFAIVGLVVDGTAKFFNRRHAQNAADPTVLRRCVGKSQS